MINVVHINTYEELMPLFSAQVYQEKFHRHRSSYVYRGMGRTTYKMETSLARNCKDQQKIVEPSILRNYMKYAILDDPTIGDSIWNQMMSGQHHGLPTRLLDLTHSPLIALHFAAVKDIDQNQDEDCMIWRFDMAEIHDLLPEKYQKSILGSRSKVFTVGMLSEIVNDLDQYDNDMQDRSMVILEPSSIDQRIVNQYSFFAVVPNKMTDVEAFLDKYTNNTVKYIINKDLRWRIADELDAMGISERIIYPGLDGLSAWIARHYYVRDKW